MKDVGVKCHAAVFLKVMINLKTFFSYLFSINVNKRFTKDYLYIYKLDFSYYAFLQANFSYIYMVLVNLKNSFGNVPKNYRTGSCQILAVFQKIIYILPISSSAIYVSTTSMQIFLSLGDKCALKLQNQFTSNTGQYHQP